MNSKKYILERNGEIFLNTPVADFEYNDNRISKIQLKDGKIVSGDIFISSIPYFSLFKFNKLLDKLDLYNISKLVSSPIISIYLWLDSEITKECMIILLKMHSQALFNKSRIYKIENNKYLISITISSANDLINCDKMNILSTVIKELRDLFNNEKVFKIRKFKVIKERNATLLVTPDAEKFRPTQKTKVENFFLIGDWINTGLPATLESAVKSSYRLLQLL
jgi:zeta-carotene desaturase